MVDFLFPTALELKLVAQELVPRLIAQRPIFDIMPMREVDSHLLEWDQKDNYVGLQNIRGLNGMPTRVAAIGAKRYQEQPGVYGEYASIDELQITTRRPYGTFAGSINIADLVREKQDQLLGRRLDRIELIGWTLLSTGVFSVADGTSVLATGAYTTQTFSAGVPWATVATSTPLADIRAIQLKSRGYSVDFGSRARMYMNRSTANAFLSNTNAADLGGRRGTGLSTINGPEQLNQLLAMDDLPSIVVYDQGYLDSTGTFQLFVPNNKIIVVGARTDGDPIAEFRFTRNANNPDVAPGPYMRVIDEADRIPRTVEVHDGFNGGPVIYHPAAVVVATI